MRKIQILKIQPLLPRCSSESSLYCRAVQSCDKRKKVTITPEDILDAIREAEFQDFEEPLSASLAAFRAQEKATRKPSAKRQKIDNGDVSGGAAADADVEESVPMDSVPSEKAVDGVDQE